MSPLPTNRRFHFAGDIDKAAPRKRLRLHLLDETLATVEALCPPHATDHMVRAVKALTVGDYVFVPNAGWLFCVNPPEPCGVCNGNGCAECDPNR